MKQHAAQAVAGILRPDQVRQRQRDFLRRREAVFAVQDHAVAAIEHQHRGAGALILGLMHVQIGVFEIERDLQPFALHGARTASALTSRFSVSPNSYCFDAAAGFDAGRQIARIVRAEAGFAQRSEQILQRLEAQKVEGLVGDLDLDLADRRLPVAARSGLLLACAADV